MTPREGYEADRRPGSPAWEDLPERTRKAYETGETRAGNGTGKMGGPEFAYVQKGKGGSLRPSGSTLASTNSDQLDECSALQERQP
jgi:hypothetical protein